ncbi:MFS transporter [Mycetocola tolaasinivorans]|uniref:MFS transporter n=1 Tax=Mycetocola tolaasinivorans TaxID=76635 RepID=UPI0016006D63|nr:MFS transporter [Mycetocola tolaasinivorans]
MTSPGSESSRGQIREILAVPGSPRTILFSALGRLPVAMTSIALLFYIQRSTGSFGDAGLVSGSALVGTAIGSVVQGRLVDRLGPTRTLATATGIYVSAAALAFLLVESGGVLPVLMVCAAVLGLAQPALGTASRAIWAHRLPAGPAREFAFTYEAISLETFFILGPALAAILASLEWAGTGLVVAVAMMSVGTVGFLTSPLVRTIPRSSQRGRPLLHIIAIPGMQTLILAVLGFGIIIGFVEVAVPAVANLAGVSAYGGILLGLWSLTSVVFGIAYARRPWPRSYAHRAPVLLIGFGVLVALVAFVQGGLVVFTIALMVSGLLITPQATLHSLIVEAVTTEDQAAEAFGWVLAAVTAGVAIGHLSAGQIVEDFGPSVALASTVIPAVVLGGIVALRRRTLRGG